MGQKQSKNRPNEQQKPPSFPTTEVVDPNPPSPSSPSSPTTTTTTTTTSKTTITASIEKETPDSGNTATKEETMEIQEDDKQGVQTLETESTPEEDPTPSSSINVDDSSPVINDNKNVEYDNDPTMENTEEEDVNDNVNDRGTLEESSSEKTDDSPIIDNEESAENNNDVKEEKDTHVTDQGTLASHLKDSRLTAVVESIMTDGYAVLPSILNASECELTLNLLWDFVEDISSGRVSRSDPTTWYPRDNHNDKNDDDDDDPWPHSGYEGYPDTFQSHGAGFLLGQLREWMAERVFEPLYNTQNLHTSKEGFTLLRPKTEPKSKFEYNNNNDDDRSKNVNMEENESLSLLSSSSKGEHYDQTHELFGLHSIQSSVALLDQEEGKDACFICYPKSHSRIHNLLTQNNNHASDDSYVPLTHHDVLRLKDEFQLQPKCVYVKAGDVILWRSDLVHASIAHHPQSSSSSSSSVNLGAVAYVSMIPSSFTPLDQLDSKMQAYKLSQTGNHRAHLETKWYVHQRTGSSSSHFLRPYFRFGYPKVSWRQAELYGLVPYDIQNEEEIKKEATRAIKRGVRFVEPHLNNFYCKSPRLSDIILSPPPPSSSPSEVIPPPKRGVPCDARVELLQPSYGPLLGQDKYLGGVASPCGDYIYGVCGHAKRTLRVNCDTGEVDMIGPEYPGKFKWLRGVDIPADVMKMNVDEEPYPKGACLALPCNADAILKINPHTNKVSTFGGPFQGGWKWHGGNLAENGFVYAIPADTNRVLKINPRTEETWLIGPDLTYDKQKWFGGIFAKTNGCIYGIPHNTTGVLKIDPHTDTITILGEGQLPEGQWKWHGGLANKDGSKIYGFPNNAPDVLVVDTTKDEIYTISSPDFELKSGRHRNDDKYKYLGGALTSDGKYAYLFPCDAERVLRIDIENDTLKLIGPELLEGENKYQNGFAGKDSCIYAIPQRASSVLRVVPPVQKENGEEEEDMVEMLYCGDEMVGVKDKFEGGVMGGRDGAIYCIPLRAKSVLRVLLQDPK